MAPDRYLLVPRVPAPVLGNRGSISPTSSRSALLPVVDSVCRGSRRSRTGTLVALDCASKPRRLESAESPVSRSSRCPKRSRWLRPSPPKRRTPVGMDLQRPTKAQVGEEAAQSVPRITSKAPLTVAFGSVAGRLASPRAPRYRRPTSGSSRSLSRGAAVLDDAAVEHGAFAAAVPRVRGVHSARRAGSSNLLGKRGKRCEDFRRAPWEQGRSMARRSATPSARASAHERSRRSSARLPKVTRPVLGDARRSVGSAPRAPRRDAAQPSRS